ncbi:MAG: prepilin-type N-terminal cleavage/methylation domain-containing protein [Chitinispirillia bacterium]|nr:prepilin-type N-terminal cleavage/methylation domain-containing protein [Chitinispirillia bacterium]MCL2241699.1 prepilin-type N-terminal cleavage/methylation domain-containing protein [Chitinispirillia bacterium]
MTNKPANRGFTLVEVIVAAVLLMALAFGAYSFFMLYIRETRDASVQFKMQRQAEAFMDDVARQVRSSYRVVSSRADYADSVNWAAVTSGGALPNSLFCFNDSNTVLRGFRFVASGNTGIIQDTIRGVAGWRNFTIDGDSITLARVNGLNFFGFNAARTQTNVNMTLRRITASRDTFDLRFTRGDFRCRVTGTN